MPSNQRSNGSIGVDGARGAGDALIDDTNRALLVELQADARLSLAELGRRVGLSSPAVAERLGRLERAGVIRGYHASLDPVAIGYPLTAVIRIRPAPGQLHKLAASPSRRPRGRRVRPNHGRGLLPAEGARPLGGAPRGADRRLHPVRPDDHLDRPVLAGRLPRHLARFPRLAVSADKPPPPSRERPIGSTV